MKINQEISLESDMPFQVVWQMTMHWEVDLHAVLSVRGLLKNDRESQIWKHDYRGTKIKIWLNDKDILFWGIIQAVDLKRNHGIIECFIKSVSASALFDQENEKIYRAFQNPNQRYSYIVKTIAEEQSGNVICTVGDEEIKRPLIAYEETRWEFLKRLASHHGSCLLADVITGKPNFWFGMRMGRRIQEELEEAVMPMKIQKTYERNEAGETIKTYIWKSEHYYMIGDWTYLKGRKYTIYMADVQLEQGQLVFRYQFREMNKTEIKYNKTFTGRSLWGTVEERNEEGVKVSLDIGQEKGEYYYPWKPETGNALYAIPEIGSRVAVYFSDSDERKGIAVRCIGKEGKEKQTEEKKFSVPKEAMITLAEGEMILSKREEKIILEDSGNIGFYGNKIEIRANGKIKMRAKKIVLSSSTELKAVTE